VPPFLAFFMSFESAKEERDELRKKRTFSD